MNKDPFNDTVICDFMTAIRHFAAVRDAGLKEIADYEAWEDVACREGFGITSSDHAKLRHGATRAYIAGLAVAVLKAEAAHAAANPGQQRAVRINAMFSTSGGAPEPVITAAIAAETEAMASRSYGNGMSEMIAGTDPEAAFWLGVTAQHVGEEAARQAADTETGKPVRLAAQFASRIHGHGLADCAVCAALIAYSDVLYDRAEGQLAKA